MELDAQDFAAEAALGELREKVEDALGALERIEGRLAAVEATLGLLAASYSLTDGPAHPHPHGDGVTIHPAVGKAAGIVLEARGRKFTRATIMTLDELAIAVKAQNVGACMGLMSELERQADFRMGMAAAKVAPQPD